MEKKSFLHGRISVHDAHEQEARQLSRAGDKLEGIIGLKKIYAITVEFVGRRIPLLLHRIF